MKKISFFYQSIILMLFCFTLSSINAQDISCYLVESDNFAPIVNVNADNCSNSCAEGVDNNFYAESATVTIYVNFHYFLNDNGEGNYPRPEDAAVGEIDGVEKANDLLLAMNGILDNLQQNALGSADHIPHSNIRFENFTNEQNPNDAYGGVWFHNIPSIPTNNPFNNFSIFGSFGYKNNFSEYGAQVIDIFLGDDPNQLGAGATPLFGNRMAVSGLYTAEINNGNIDFFDHIILHELGHDLGLNHAHNCDSDIFPDVDVFEECSDNTAPFCPCSTGPNTACIDPSAGMCNIWTSGSNNLMGGNPVEDALTPCQVDFVHKNLIENPPAHLKIDFCAASEPDIVINSGDDITWNISRHLNRNVVVKSGGKLTIKTTIAMPENSRITVEPNGNCF